MRTWRSQIIVKSTFTYLYTYDAVKANMAPKPSLIGSVLSRWRFKTCINFRYYICFTTSLILIKNQVERGDGKIDIVVKLHARNLGKISRLCLVNSFFGWNWSLLGETLIAVLTTNADSCKLDQTEASSH